MIILKIALKSPPKLVNPNHTIQETLMDTKVEIDASFPPLKFEEINFDSFGFFLDKKDNFRVVQSSLYYSIAPTTYHFYKFVTWIVSAYVSQRNYIVSYIGENVL